MLAKALDGTRNDQLNRCTFSLAQFVKSGELPEDWLRAQLETRAVDLGLPVFEARATISSAFRAAPPRRLR